MSKPRENLRLSVVIPTHQRSESLALALASLRLQDFPRDEFEVLVVSNLDDAQVKSQVEALTKAGVSAMYLGVGRVGVNHARNLGIEKASGEILFFLDDDCRLSRRDHLSILSRRFERFPEVGIRGGFYSDTIDASSSARTYNAIVNAWLRGRSPEKGPMVGGNFSVRSALIGSARFDEAITYGGSEVSFQRELVARNVGVSLDFDLDVEHDCEVGALTLIKKAWKQGRRKHHDPDASLAKSLIALMSSDAGSAENLRRLVSGAVYGGISQVSWQTGRLTSRFSTRL
ncbi:MAG: glycosyltransferase family A protein [Bdellovibrionota bacterium]